VFLSSDENYIPLSALQHFMFCPRQCALIHIEQVWAENLYTAEGRIVHEKAHDGDTTVRKGVRTTRTLSVSSRTLRVAGQCDIVEFYEDGRIVPVEYKRGKPKVHRADEIQLCAQAISLEEMLHTTIPLGEIFYDQRKRRTEVVFDSELRSLTKIISDKLHAMVAEGKTPPAEYEKQKCETCSLKDLCLPKIFIQSTMNTD